MTRLNEEELQAANLHRGMPQVTRQDKSWARTRRTYEQLKVVAGAGLQYGEDGFLETQHFPVGEEIDFDMEPISSPNLTGLKVNELREIVLELVNSHNNLIRQLKEVRIAER